MKKLVLLLVVLSVVCGGAFAEEAAVEAKPVAAEKKAVLGLGDSLPALRGLEWLQGTDPMAAEEKPEYMLYDCWATWCGPCIQSIPHMNELAEKYADKGVGVVGIAVWDKEENVKALLASGKVEMKYPVAIDAFEFVAKKWMKPAQISGVPCIFVVKAETREILWIGHPMTVDGVLEQLVAGDYDIRTQRQRQAFEAKLQAAIQARDWDAAEVAVNEWKTVDPDEALSYELWIQVEKRDEGTTCAVLKKIIAKDNVPADDVMNVMGLMVLVLDAFPDSEACSTLAAEGAKKFSVQAPDSTIVQGMYWYALNANKEYEEAAKVADKLIENDWENKEKLAALSKSLLLKEMDSRYVPQATKAINRALELDGDYGPALLQKIRLEGFAGNGEGVKTFSEKLLAEDSSDGELLNEAAWELMTDKRVDGDFNKVALQLAEAAELQTGGTNPAVLDTLALAEFKNGNIERAIELEKAAIALVPDYEALQLQLQMFEDALKEEEGD